MAVEAATSAVDRFTAATRDLLQRVADLERTAQRSGVRARRDGVILTDAPQAIATGVGVDITWGTEVSDVDGWTSGGSATLTCPAGRGGAYLVCCSLNWSGFPGVADSVIGHVNGTTAYAGSGGGGPWCSVLTYGRTFTAGDTLKFQAFQISGVALNATSRLEIIPLP